MKNSSIKKPFFSLFVTFFLRSVFSVLIFAHSNSQAAHDEPIALVGHGMLFDMRGQRIEPSLEFLAEAQFWYELKLLEHLSEDAEKEYRQWHEKVLGQLKPGDIETLMLKQQLLEWAFKQVKKKSDLKSTMMKLRAIDRNTAQIATAYGEKKFEYTERFVELKKRLDVLNRGGRDSDEIFKATVNRGQAYLDECSNAQVPIPPSINQMDPSGLNGWRSEGFIPDANNFLGGGPAELRSYRSVSPAGMCYSLPRYKNNSLSLIGLDGVICLSETTSKVCFWDNVWTPPGSGNTQSFDITPGDIIPIGVPNNPGEEYQAGGAELEFASGGECTDCHAGENPFIVHPKAGLLNAPSALGGTVVQNWEDLATPVGDLNHFSPYRYEPLVGASWWQNGASMQSSAVPAACNGCHVKGVFGRLPHLSNRLFGYCNTVLPNARDTTMPPWAPGSQTAAINSMRATYCNAPENTSVADYGDPHITTVDGTRYDFQSAGEFTLLRAVDEGFELQARQSPVLVNFTPSPNHHTGLASCPSLNTAVGIRLGKTVISYQPEKGVFAEKEDLKLFVDGKLITQSGSLNLGNGHQLDYHGPGQTLRVSVSDGSIIKVDPRYWSTQGYWYLNIDVENTYAREGVMGLIGAGDWLPRLPDGSSLGAKPAALYDRHKILNVKFANAWRVDNSNSLFLYPPGRSTADFTDLDWPSPPGGDCTQTTITADIPFVKEPRWDIAEKACSNIKDKAIFQDCLLDVAVLGDEEAARVHTQAAAKQP